MIRRLARLLLGVAFVSSGIDGLRDIDRRAQKAEAFGVGDPVNASRAVAAAQIGSGVLLGLNRLPRLSALIAGATVVPDALTVHDFWTEKDSDAQKTQRASFARDLGLLGGLLISAVDTGGRESVPHRAARSSREAAKAAAAKVPIG